MTYLYKIDEHPETSDLIMRKFEIVNSTPKYYDIAPREIPNQSAENTTKRILRNTVDHPLYTMNDYFRSAREAWVGYIGRQENLIKDAEKTIERALIEIGRVKQDIPESSLRMI